MRYLSRIISAVLMTVMLLSFISTGVSAKENDDPLPEKYSSVEQGYVTPVKNQKQYGTCWAHGTIAACEASLIKNNGYPKDTDLSEFHLAYASKHQMKDRLGLLKNGDSIYYTEKYMTDGSNDYIAAVTMACWNGLVEESAHYEQFSSKKFDFTGLDQLDFASKELLYCMDAAHLTAYYAVNTYDIDEIKRYVMKYGGGTISLFSDDSFRDENKGVWFYNEESYRKCSSHMMCIVGWDDTLKAEDLSVNGYTPKQDGAYIVKNSWGTEHGNDGYYYVPYEEYMLKNGKSLFFELESADNYTYQYAYDDQHSTTSRYDKNSRNRVKAADVFEAVSDDEVLEAVSFFPMQDDSSYEINIYTGLQDGYKTPEDGVLSCTLSGDIDRSGYRTIKLDDPIDLDRGEKFSVVITCMTAPDTDVTFACSYLDHDDDGHVTADVDRGIAYQYFEGEGYMDVLDISYGSIPRIKAFTSSQSAPAMVEPDDYLSYEGISKNELIEQYNLVMERYRDILKHQINYNADDVDRMYCFYGMYDAFNTSPEMFTSSEIYQTKENFEHALDTIRYIDVYGMLDNYSSIALKLSTNRFIIDTEQYRPYLDECNKITDAAKNQLITPENYADFKNALVKEFSPMVHYFVSRGLWNTHLQMYGDVNGDDVISIIDVSKIQMTLAKLISEDFSYYYCCDVNNDGENDIADATCIQQYLAKLITNLSVYDDNSYIEDGYTKDTDKSELVSYLESSLSKRSYWKDYEFSTYDEYSCACAAAIYEKAASVLENSADTDNVYILFYTRLLIANVPEKQ